MSNTTTMCMTAGFLLVAGCALGGGDVDPIDDDRGDIDDIGGDDGDLEQASCDPSGVIEGLGFAGEKFGKAVAAYDDFLVIGAPGSSTSDEVASVHILKLTEAGYLGKAVLEPATEAEAKLFGEAVAISVDTVVVGARGDSTFDVYGGSAHVYTKNAAGAWPEQARLLAGDGAEFDYFGRSVAIDGNTIVVGAPGHDGAGTGRGAAYVFERRDGDWNEVARLAPNDPQDHADFGWSVSIHGSLVAVGAYGADAREGATYVFARGTGGTWSQQAKLKSLSPEVYDGFGKSTSVWGDQIAVGAPSAGTGGRVTIYAPRLDGSWVAIDEVVPSDIEPNDNFGVSLQMRGDTLVAGAEYADPTETGSGAAWVFSRGGEFFDEQHKLFAEDGGRFDRFGGSVALAPTGPVAGIGQRDRGDMTDVGAALTYRCE